MEAGAPKFSIIVLFFILGFCAQVMADVVYLKNGRHIEGLIKKEDEKNIVLDLGYGTVTFLKEEITKIERSDRFQATMLRKKWKEEKDIEIERRLEKEKELEEAQRRKELEPKEVGFVQESSQIFVDALLNEKVKAKLLLDTGASTVLITKALAEKLGINTKATKDNKMQVQGVDGRNIDAKYVILKSISVEGVELKDVDSVVLLEEDSGKISDGLLGMSFLNKFNFQIDTENKKLILKKREE